MMHSVLYVLLLVGVARAHYHSNDARNLVERDEPENDIYGIEIVPCPVCENSSRVRDWQSYSEACPINIEGKFYKKCRFGTYINNKCGSRRDCYRGENEQCTEKRDVDHYDLRCGPGLYCHPMWGICSGITTHIDSNIYRLIKPNSRFNERPSERTLDISFPVRRERRQD